MVSKSVGNKPMVRRIAFAFGVATIGMGTADVARVGLKISDDNGLAADYGRTQH